MQKSMSLKYEPASEPLRISSKWLFLNGGRDGLTNPCGQVTVVTLLFIEAACLTACLLGAVDGFDWQVSSLSAWSRRSFLSSPLWTP